MSKPITQFAACCLIGLWSLAGCSKPSIPMSDAAAAKQLVAATLQQWSEGKNWSELTQLKPPVYMSEDGWRNGWRLREFHIDDTAEMVGTNVRVSVKLRCQDKQGAVKDMSIRYFVTTTPAQTISREES
jgi:hypothetical protein